MEHEEQFHLAMEFAAEMGRQQFERRFNAATPKTQSPIERTMLAMFIAFETATQPSKMTISPDPYVWPELRQEINSEIFLQAKVGKYLADFMIRVPCNKGIHFTAVECDGHDYHERTKIQAARDKTRDRWMTAQGITVVRFAGSEIWADAAKCVSDCLRSSEHSIGLMGGRLSPPPTWSFSIEKARQRMPD